MDKQILIDRILETENLTDELEDADANRLLDWGIAHLDEALQAGGQAALNGDDAGERVNALMGVMRKINRVAGSYADKDPQALAQDLSGLSDLAANVFPAQRARLQASAAAAPAAADQLQRLPTGQVLDFLTRWAHP